MARSGRAEAEFAWQVKPLTPCYTSIMVNYDVPFYESTRNLNCFEMSLKMILGYFRPEEDYSLNELEKITRKIPGKYTWPHAALLWLAARSAEVHLIEGFDHQRFIQEGGEYLLDEFGQEVGGDQIRMSDIDQEIAIDKELLQRIKVEKRIPEAGEIKDYLDKGFLVECNLNQDKLNGKVGYTGHSVVIKGYTNQTLIMHDPGLPAYPDRHVTFSDFEAAWAYPEDKIKNIIAIRF